MYAAEAQSMGSTYRTALGVKVWDGAGITLKHFVASGNAVEAIGYFYNRGFRLTGLYEFHGDIAGAQGALADGAKQRPLRLGVNRRGKGREVRDRHCVDARIVVLPVVDRLPLQRIEPRLHRARRVRLQRLAPRRL